jgi:hypothetical protein
MRPARIAAVAADGFYVPRIPARRGGTMNWASRTVTRIERLHRLDRTGGRSPLYVITVMDREGRVLEVAACDPDEYPEYR